MLSAVTTTQSSLSRCTALKQAQSSCSGKVEIEHEGAAKPTRFGALDGDDSVLVNLAVPVEDSALKPDVGAVPIPLSFNDVGTRYQCRGQANIAVTPSSLLGDNNHW